MMNRWVEASRPRTLPLALASILLGNILAFSNGSFSFEIATLAIITTILLQVLSNFANDFGDTKNGVDTKDRKVALRTVQTGKISPTEMKNAIIFLAILSFVAGIFLLFQSLKDESLQVWFSFLGLGILCIIAAITYTIGKRPYGYMGLGDISVFLFFGWVGTLGSYYLQSKQIDFSVLLPASACGFLSVAVLNLNNLRDIDNDIKNGKNSIPVRIGKKNGFLYQQALYISAILGFGLYPIISGIEFSNVQNFALLVGYYPLIKISRELKPNMGPKEIDPYLKKTSLSTLWLIIVFGIVKIFLSH
ncbi:1,4-dihydroxy-2-naphthoate polyprenyltransferase [Aquirufa sp. ROCK2-A2]